MLLQTYAVLWNLTLGKRLNWLPLLEIPRKHLYRNDHRSNDYNLICSECMDQTLKTFIITMIVAILSFGGALIGPVHSYLQDGTLVTLYELRIPFLSEHPRSEYIVNMSWQGGISALGVIALFPLEGMLAIVNNAITVSSKLTLNEFATISNDLEMGEIARELSAQKLKTLFKQIIYMDK